MRAASCAALMMLAAIAVGNAEAAQPQGGETTPWGSTASAPGYGRFGPGGYGPGMMHGWGWRGGYGLGYGMGPGMMGDYGPGYGMGWGRGGGFGGAPLAALDLTPEQQDKISNIHEDHRRNNWNTMGQLQAERFRLHQMYNAEKIDANAIDEQQKKIDERRRQMLKSRVETHNQMMAVLTPEQRRQVRSFGPWWMEQEVQ